MPVWLKQVPVGGGSGVLTVIAAVPLFVSDVAVMVAEPDVTPLTRPLELTVATDVLLLVQLIVRPASVLPFASLGVAVSWTVCPAVTEADAGLTVTVATGRMTALTVRAAEPLCPSLVAVIVADPAVTPVASPLPSTLATELLELAQVIARPPSAVPVESSGIATNCTVLPTDAVALVGSTATWATGTAVAVTTAVAESDRPLTGSVATTVYRPA